MAARGTCATGGDAGDWFSKPRSQEDSVGLVAALRPGLDETGFVEERNVRIEFRWAEGHYDRFPGAPETWLRTEWLQSLPPAPPVHWLPRPRPLRSQSFFRLERIPFNSIGAG